MQIKVIAVGSTKWQRFIHRWGVSFLIGEDLLFDTFGDPGVLLRNARRFNVDIAKIKHIVLSHDDWDHISGLWYLLPSRNDIAVYICPGFRQEVKDRIASFGVKIIEAKEAIQIEENIYSTGEFYGESKGEKIYEQSVVIRTTNGLAVICGCAHPGIENIVRQVKELYHKNVHSLIGGFHLKDNNGARNMRIVSELKACGVCKVVPMHCTGKRAEEIMRTVFGTGFVSIKEGGAIEL
jgi:7,8-dihydropterin-6-yl-methyl-4-(beta-D-ribofuranosyl)aminobenzene 5'-phosphate synthase